jgi:hypothetical protein
MAARRSPHMGHPDAHTARAAFSCAAARTFIDCSLMLDGDIRLAPMKPSAATFTHALSLPAVRKVGALLFMLGLLVASSVHTANAAEADDEVALLRDQFAAEVDRRLEVPVAAQERYIALLEDALRVALVVDLPAQSFLLVDRSAQVQAAMIVVRTGSGNWEWIGATSVSTGKPGSYEHFFTPLGVHPHSLANPDYRSEGTYNENNIRGYGVRGMRVFDFGWQEAQRGWGAGGVSQMRLQMHATDPTVLERRLGNVASEGCVRIPGSMNAFMDRRGILDADYERAVAEGKKLWVLQPGRQVVPWPGRYMVVVDSGASERPDWSPAPGKRAVRAGRRNSREPPLL